MQLLISTLACLAAAVSAEVSGSSLDGRYTCIGTFIFGRHNDRVVKPATVLTTFGAREQVDEGNFYRERYFGLDAEGNHTDSDFIIDGLNKQGVFIYGETYAQCPVSTVLEYSQLSFLQGLYPPTHAVNTNHSLSNTEDASLVNGTEIIAPFNGYQYVYMDVQSDTSETNYYIEGDDMCPASDDAISAEYSSEWYQNMNSTTLSFFQSLRSILPQKKFQDWKLNFDHAMDIFDYMNVNWIHNETIASRYNETLLRQVADIADQYQWSISHDADNLTNNFTIGGQSLLGAVYNYLNATLNEGTPYINYLIGSFNTMYQMQSLLQLDEVSANFTGMPNYGCTYVWDLLKDEHNDTFVMFSFKNGTLDGDVLTTYPLFGQSSLVLSWDDFSSRIQKVAITSLKSWCTKCGSDAVQCNQYSSAYTLGTQLETQGVDLESLANGDAKVTKKGGLTNAGAGGIGAGVTIGVFALLGLAGYALYKARSKKDDVEAGGRALATNNIALTESHVGTSAAPSDSSMSGTEKQ